ncbi:MAG: GAF domain-containing protein, partial [Anaerolineae bacterium]|nr:GAF domain-containing protein [Anaerolineae bacterium]
MENKTTEQLLQEIAELRRRLAELEAAEAEHKRVVEALRGSEALFHSLIESLPQNIFSKDLEGRFTFANQRYCLTEGKSLADIIGKTDFDLHPPELAEKYRRDDRWVIENKCTLEMEEEHQPKNGERFHVQVIKTPVYDANGQVTGILGIFWDITERKQAEEALESRVKQLAALSRASQVVTASLELDQVLAEIVSLASQVSASDYTSVVLVDETGHIRRSTENIPGIPTIKYRVRKGGVTDWILGSRQAVIVDEIGEDGSISPAPGEGAPRTANPHIIKAGIKSFAALPLEVRGRLLGVLYLHSLRPAAFHDQLPLLTAFANQAAIAIENARLYEALEQELAERRRAEEALRESEAQLRWITDNMLDMISQVDSHGIIRYVSPSVRNLGYDPEDLLEKSAFELVHPDDVERMSDEVDKSIKAHEPAIKIEYRYKHADGHYLYLESVCNLLYDDKGRFAGAIFGTRDVTERQQLEQQLLTIHELGQKLVLIRDEQEIANSVVEAAHQVLKLQVCSLWMVDEEQNALVIAAHRSPSQIPHQHLLPLDSEQGITVTVARTGESIYLPDVSQDPRYISLGFPARSELCLPLKVGDKVIGVLNAESDCLDAFSPADVQLMEALANAAAGALENARLYEERERQTAQLELINRIGQELATTLDMPTLARIVYQYISRLMDTPHMVISRYDPQTRLIHADFAIVDGEETDVSAFAPIPLEPDTGLQSKVIVTARPLIVDDLQAQLRQVKTVHYVQERDSSKPQSALYAPLLAGERVIGVLNVQSYRPKAYSAEDARLLTTIASQLALAIENARLFQAEQKRAQQLAIINELGQALATTLDLPTVYRTAGKYVQRLVDCASFGISLFDPEQQTITADFVISDGVELDVNQFPPLVYEPQARTGRSKAIASGQSVVVHDLPGAARTSNQVYSIGGEPVPQSALYVPMLVEGQVIGLLELQSYLPDAYRQEDVELLATAANQIGLSIQNARLFRETLRLKEFNESIVQSMAEGIVVEDTEGN